MIVFLLWLAASMLGFGIGALLIRMNPSPSNVMLVFGFCVLALGAVMVTLAMLKGGE